MALVTVFVPSYNHERYVLETLESIRLQTHPDIQLIVIDDCSSDGTARVIEDWIDRHRSRFVEAIFQRNQKNQGICRNFNLALERTKGEFFAAVATDDEWYTRKIARQVEAFEAASAKLAVVYADADLMDMESGPLEGSFLETISRGFTPTPPDGNLLRPLLVHNFIPAVTAMVRTECFKTVGRYDESLWFEDWDMWIRMARRYEFGFVPERLARYRMTGGSMSARGKQRFDEFQRTMGIRYADLEEPYATELNLRVIEFADWLYEIRSVHAVEAARRARTAYPNRYWFVLTLCLRLGIPHRVFHRMVDRYLGRQMGEKAASE